MVVAEDSLDAQIAAAAGRQHGVFTLVEARQVGFTASMVRRRVERGQWERLDRATFRIAGSSATWRQQLAAACFTAGPDALASHRSAAALHRLEGIPAGTLEITAPRWLRRPRNLRLHESQDLSLEDYDVVDGIPCTSPVRTVVDLGAVVSLERLEAALDDGARRKLYTLADVDTRRRQVARRGRNGVGPLRTILQERSPDEAIAHSGFESRLSRLLVAGGFDRPVRQHRIYDGERFVAQLDLSYPPLQIGLEADSEQWHMARRRFIHDRTRWNELESIGWRILLVTFHHLRHDHDHILATLRRTMRQQRKLLQIA